VLFSEISALLIERGFMMRQGTIVDATIIAAPSSTKNKRKERDPEMHQTKKGNQWYFGMKAHIGVDAESGVVHTTTGTAANVADITEMAKLLHGDERAIFADAGYTGAAQREELKDRSVEWQIAVKRGIIKNLPEGCLKEWAMAIEREKSSIRARVEHVFHVVKNLFHYRKARYRGLAKNIAHLHSLFALANLVIIKRPLLAMMA
jgi:IS5 family transposase